MSIDIGDPRPDCANELIKLAGGDALPRWANYICRGDRTGNRTGRGRRASGLTTSSAQERAHSPVSAALTDVNV